MNGRSPTQAREGRKKRAKADKQRKAEEAEKLRQQQEREQQQEAQAQDGVDGRPSKRRRLSADAESREEEDSASQARPILRFNVPSWGPARTIDQFERLNHIEEGSYGFVSRAREITTGEIVAIKKMKMEGADHSGFPVTALREIQTLSAARHRHIVELREVVNGEGGKVEDVFLVMEFLEHDLKTLMEDMEEPFLPSEVKTLMLQLGSAVEFLHERWILHVRVTLPPSLPQPRPIRTLPGQAYKNPSLTRPPSATSKRPISS
ncbi:hypothetical protein H2203_007401 [Taxawa tesnikishii (nom. ined.)]|nr:hypothetical protein H2203_007401 [Dothideales sp. JES 119]